MTVGALAGRVAVVTGGGRGIGRAIAIRYAREGATVVVSSRTESDLRQVEAEIRDIGSEAHLVVADALDPADARRPVSETLERYGAVDVLVNNVGGTVGSGHDPLTVGKDDHGFEQTLVLNLTSAWWVTTAALPTMRDRRWGRVINIGSGASKTAAGGAGLIAYTTAKHALVGFTKALAQSLGELGITVNCLCPGWTNTSLLDWEALGRRSNRSGEETRRIAARDNAQNRILEPEELTGLATLLASTDGGGITGQVLSVDGGYRI